MKKEIKTNDSNAIRNSLFSFNKTKINNPNKFLKTPEKYNNKLNQLKEPPEDKSNPNRKNSDKANNKEKDFNSKLKDFIKQNNSYSTASGNNSKMIKKESSLLRNKAMIHARNQSKMTNFSSKIKNNNDHTDCCYLTTNTAEHINLQTNSVNFNNTLDDFNHSTDNSFKSNLELNFYTEENIKKLNLKCNENSNTPHIKIIDDNDADKIKEIDKNNEEVSKAISLDNFQNHKDTGSFLNRKSFEEKKSLLVKNDKNNFPIQLKTNVININESCEETYDFLREKHALVIYKKFSQNNSSSQSNKKESNSTSINKNKLGVNRNTNVTENKNNVNPMNNLKNKTANIKKNQNEIKHNIYKIPHLTISAQKLNNTETKKKHFNHINKDNYKSNKNKIFNLFNSADKIKRNVSVGFKNGSTSLKNSKTQKSNFLGANLNSSNESSNLEAEKDKLISKNHVNIIDENHILNTTEEKKSTKSFKNLSTKSVFYSKQSNKFLINLLNSRESSYSDKFISIVDKFKGYISILISFISRNEGINENISIYKSTSNIILNASFAHTKIYFPHLLQKYCEDTKTDCSELKNNCLADNLEKNIKYQIDDVLLGISPIVLDCNILKQEFIESNAKSRKNIVSPKLQNEELIEENIEQIVNRSEQRCEKIKVIFKEMRENLSEVSDLLVNEFGENLSKNLEEFKMQDCEAILKSIKNLNSSKNSCNSNTNNCSNGFKDISSKEDKCSKLPKNSKAIEIDLADDKKKFGDIFNIISDNRKGLKEILQGADNSECAVMNYFKTDTNEKSISIFSKSKINENKIIEANAKSDLSNDNIPQDFLFTEDLASSNMQRKKEEKRINPSKISLSQSRNLTKQNLVNSKNTFGNAKLIKIPNVQIKNDEIVKRKLLDKPKKVVESKVKSVPIINSNSKSKTRSINENKENNKKLVNKKRLENIRIESTIELSSNEKTKEINNQKTQVDPPAEAEIEENKFRVSLGCKNNLKLSEEKSSYLPEKNDSKNFINNSNYISINVNINSSEKRDTLEYKIINDIYNNLTPNSFVSKSDNSVTNIEGNNPKSRNVNKKLNFESFRHANISYTKYNKLSNQRRSHLESKFNQGIQKRISQTQNSMEDESDMMTSMDEFDSGEKTHFDIPLSAINYANMPICGSRIIRRHSSFSKVLEKFNYKRFFNFRKSSYISPPKIANNTTNLNSNNQNSNKSIQTQNNENSFRKYNNDNNNNNLTKTEEKVTPEIKEFNLKKIEVVDSENYSEMNSSAPDLSISVGEICNDFFHCCDKIEIKNNISCINFEKLLKKDRNKRSKPIRRKSRSVMNSMVVNVKKLNGGI